MGTAPPQALSWWQTRWAVVPGLLLLGTVALSVMAGLSGDDTTKPSKDESASAARKDDAEPAPTSTAQAEPTVTAAPMSVVPNVAGLSRSQAENALTDAGLIVGKVRQVPSARPRGTVLRQGTQVGTTVSAGSAITLVVAAPYPRVPSIVGRAKAEASSRLRSAGFEVKVTVETRTSGKNGVVLRQNPVGLERAKPHSTVTIVVSSIVRPLAPPAQNCTAGYKPCLAPASDYDCAGGSGDGPAYADGPVYVTGSDPYDLDRDGDGVACET